MHFFNVNKSQYALRWCRRSPQVNARKYNLQVQREASPSISLGMDSDHDEYAEWMRVFESIVQLLDDYEQYRHNTANVSARENIAIRMESVFSTQTSER